MATVKFPVTAGAFVRGPIKRAVKQYAWSHDYSVDIQEDKGWFQSAMYFRVTDIPPSKANDALAELQELLNKLTF